ncbi:MAG: hypothetical protein R2747_03890 [Pyrinomonadaceae bacterium]
MLNQKKIEQNSDSLIELLTAQCADLEKLLQLAREETLAAEGGDFLGILDIVSRREELSRRLETFQRQIAELRGTLGEAEEDLRRSKISAQVVAIANLTLAQDRETRLLLSASREESRKDLRNLDRYQKGTNSYLRQETRGLAFDRNL